MRDSKRKKLQNNRPYWYIKWKMTDSATGEPTQKNGQINL